MRNYRIFKHVLPALMCILLTSFTLIADNTLRGKRLKASGRTYHTLSATTASRTPKADTLWLPVSSEIIVSGYDKPLRSYRETFLLTNGTKREMLKAAMTIIYRDMQGRQLHQRTDTLDAPIPAGETRMLRMQSWDTQHSYYYHLGQRPRTANVTPYDITCRIEFITLKPETNND